jgi:hypothetical protein
MKLRRMSSMTDQPLMRFTSRTAVMKDKLHNLPVANARVAVYPDRVEWEERSVRGGLIGFSSSFGLTAFLLPRRCSTHAIPVGEIQAVTTVRHDLAVRWVRVTGAHAVGAFQLRNAVADQVKDLLLRLMSEQARTELALGTSAD